MDRNPIQVIGRAVAILRALEHAPEGLSLAGIAEQVDLPRSTVQRIVAALSEEQLLMPASSSARVTLGPELARLARSANAGVEKIARPIMQELSKVAQETVDLSVLKGNTVMFVEHIVGNQRLVAVSAVGVSFPLHCTANGKAILSLMSLERRDKLLGDRLKRFTRSTIIDRGALEKSLLTVQSSGIAFDFEEHSVGITAVGTAFLDPSGREFAISIPVPTSRFASKRVQLTRMLKKAKADLLHELQSK